jgi:hypothetical protein
MVTKTASPSPAKRVAGTCMRKGAVPASTYCRLQGENSDRQPQFHLLGWQWQVPAAHSRSIKCSCLAYRCNSAVISIQSIDNRFLQQQEWPFLIVGSYRPKRWPTNGRATTFPAMCWRSTADGWADNRDSERKV